MAPKAYAYLQPVIGLLSGPPRSRQRLQQELKRRPTYDAQRSENVSTDDQSDDGGLAVLETERQVDERRLDQKRVEPQLNEQRKLCTANTSYSEPTNKNADIQSYVTLERF